MAEERIDGIEVTDQRIQEWSKEAEAGYPVEQLRKRGRKPLGDGASEVVPVRMDQTLLEALAARAEREHVSRSEAIRAAVRDWVNVA
ncbi:ribbon-helix-helix domain-containing protein [Lysinimonas soli]|uniref:Ribbon-helix-helix domain-containing protein n=1 Tax=Lysinimonas soli TaxID=1074233 RepID=A0ABW0NUD1_9MICO